VRSAIIHRRKQPIQFLGCGLHIEVVKNVERMKWRLACATLVMMIPFVASAQTIQDNNLHAWFMYFGDHPLSDRWSIHLESQVRRANAGLTWQQLLIRPGVNYQLSKNVMLTAGYAYIRTSPYGDVPALKAFPEHRVFEQALIKHGAGKVILQHRFRLEQRLLGIDGWELRNRFRYMLRADIPLPVKTSKGKPFGIALYEEPFVHFGGNRGIRYLDQNRAYAALTYKLSPFNRLEFGYLHQYIPQRNGIVSEHNHTLQFAWFSNLPFGGKED
jgi:hypothetical protein